MTELDELKKQTRLLKKILKVLLFPYKVPGVVHDDLPAEENQMVTIIKTVWIVTTALTFLAAMAMITGYPELAGVAVGGLAGWIGGNQNGQREDSD